jgi:diadenosine tetraphosphate (Ap4A) HIT family hydrolase
MSQCGICQLWEKDTNHQIIASNEGAVALVKYGRRSKQFPIEFLVVPREHLVSMKSPNAEKAIVAMTRLVNELADDEGQYKIECSNGPQVGQTLTHLHWHVKSTQDVWPNLRKALNGRSLDFH